MSVAPVEAHVWRVEVACHDRLGLLATISGALTDAGLSVQDALMATWGDGGAVDSSRAVETDGTPPDTEALTAAIVEAFERPLEAPPTPEVEADFDDDASPW
jgi:UTP:GlnB (protein PII) uridylyltransferase